MVSLHEPGAVAYGSRRRRLLRAIGAILVGSALLLGTGSVATADVGGRAPTVVPVHSPRHGGDGATRQAAVPTGRSYKCLEPGTLRRKAGSYVIGWCTTGMHIDISSSANGAWQAGWGEGNYQHCGWFETGLHPLQQEGIFDHNCGATTYVESHFANLINSGSTSDGTTVGINYACNRYANVRPWSTGAKAGMDKVGTLQPSTDTFKWRYLSKNNLWVLGRMIRPGTSVTYDWIFVERGCVGQPATRAPSSTS